MGSGTSKPTSNIRRNNSSTQSFGRTSYASPSYRINSPRYTPNDSKLQRVSSTQSDNSAGKKHRTASLDLGGPPAHVGEKTLLLSPSGHESRAMYVEKKSSSMFEPGTEPPALAHWLVPALLCAFAYALYNVFIKKGSASIHPILGGVILQCVAASIGTFLLLTLVYGPAQEEMFYDTSGITYALLAGVSVGMAEIISFVVSGMGVPAVQSIPIIIGGSVMFGCIIGRIFLAETLSNRGWFGVLMIAAGISLVGLDSEGTGH